MINRSTAAVDLNKHQRYMWIWNDSNSKKVLARRETRITRLDINQLAQLRGKYPPSRLVPAVAVGTPAFYYLKNVCYDDEEKEIRGGQVINLARYNAEVKQQARSIITAVHNVRIHIGTPL